MNNTSAVRDDFDRLAAFEDEGWSHNQHYHSFLLRHVPAHCDSALDVGCGTGTFARQLGKHCQHVVGIDLSPEMIRLATMHSANTPNIRFEVADLMAWATGERQFDCIASIATLHHLSLADALAAMSRCLKPGGTLLVLDLFAPVGLRERLTDLIAVPMTMAMRLRHGQVKQSAVKQAAWVEHLQNDHYLTMAEIRQTCAAVLPGAEVRRHVMWRYSVVWRKPN